LDATGSASASPDLSLSKPSASGRFQLAFQSPNFKEFVIRDKHNRIEELIDKALAAGFHAGVPLGQWYPDLKDCVLIAVTEKRTKQEIDDLVTAMKK
jgi:glycine dehydrogenase subunit 1